jgi:cell division protein FtsB
MKELRDKQRLKKNLYSFPVLIAFALVVFVLWRGAVLIMLKERESAETLETLRATNAALAVREESLEGEVARLGTEQGIIDEIRAKFNVTRPGEHLAIVVSEARQATTSEPSALKRGWAWFAALWGK